MQAVPVFHGVTAESFHHEIFPTHQPALLKGLVAHWPIVQAAQAGNQTLAEALAMNATPDPVTFAHAPPAVKGRFHYADQGLQLNFERSQAPLTAFMQLLLDEAGLAEPRALAVQGLDAQRFLPDFARAHPLPLLPPSIPPRMWIGNAACVATHADDLENLACCAAGRRRFTLFPPEQIGNLYFGPFELTPGGTPISMVDLREPDLARYPRVADALAAAQVADLEPGDVLYVPYQWYHHVEAFETINILVNYWWDPSRADLGSHWDALLHAIIAIRGLPANQRKAWRAVFDHYVFLENGDPGAHLPPEARGLLGEDSPGYIAALMDDLRANLDPASTHKRGPLK